MDGADLERAGGADWEAAKKKFDAESKKHFCFRCGERRTFERITRMISTPKGVAKITNWVCRACSQGVSDYLGGPRKAAREEKARDLAASLEPRRAEVQARSRAARESRPEGLGSAPTVATAAAGKSKKTAARRKTMNGEASR